MKNKIFNRLISFLLVLVMVAASGETLYAAESEKDIEVSGGKLSVSEIGADISETGSIGEAASLSSGISTYASTAETDDDYLETVQISGTCNYKYAYQVLDLVNEERDAAGLSSLTMDKDLLNAAMQRAAECNIYFSHTRPSGNTCYTVSSKVSGENIACGQTSASFVMNSWMNSEGHRENILESSFTTIGIGCFTQGDCIYWVQDFGTGTATTLSKPSNSTKTFSVDLYGPDFQALELFSLGASSTSIKTGKSTTLTPQVLNAQFPYDYAELKGSSFSWSSGDTSVATVSSSGKVTGKSNGSVKIKATSSEGWLSDSLKMKVKLATPSISKVSNTSSGVKIKWGKVTGASGYYIYRRTGSSGSYKKIATVKKGSTVSYTNKKSGSNKVTAGKTYSYKVVAYSGSSTSSKSSAGKIVYQTPGKLTSVKNTSSKKMTVKWTKRSSVTGYQIQYATNKDFTKNKKSVKASGAKKSSKTISKLKKGKTYYVRVRTYKKVSGKTYYSAWSSAKKVKIKK